MDALNIVFKNSYVSKSVDLEDIAIQKCVCRDWTTSLKTIHAENQEYLLRKSLEKHSLINDFSDKPHDINIPALLKFIVRLKNNYLKNVDIVVSMIQREIANKLFTGFSIEKSFQKHTIHFIIKLYYSLCTIEEKLTPYITYLIYVYIHNIIKNNSQVFKESQQCCIGGLMFFTTANNKLEDIYEGFKLDVYQLPEKVLKIICDLVCDTVGLLDHINKPE